MKKYISLILTIFIILTSILPVTASSSPNASSGGGSGGGSMGGGNVTVVRPVQTPKAEYTVSGTISLPAGMVAPEGGLKIYGGFGGVNLSEVSSVSLLSADEYIEEEVEIAYEDYEVIATIPKGSYYTTFSTTCSINTSYDGIYGKFWIYDDYTYNGLTVSNKQTISNIVQIKADVYEYSNLNCMFTTSSVVAEYTIDCDEVLKNESINTDVYIIADDGYDKYVSLAKYTNGSSASGILNLEADTNYTLYYYIPSSNKLELQKLDKGIFNIGDLCLENNNEIILKSQLYISGTISLPDGYVIEEDLSITVETSNSAVNITIPQTDNSASYIVGITKNASEYVKLSVNNDDYLMSGYINSDIELEEDEYEFITSASQSIENLNIVLAEQFIVTGMITLPDDILMDENTYFDVSVTAKNQLTGHEKTVYVDILSDELKSNYKIHIPKKICVDAKENPYGEWTVSYNFGTTTNLIKPNYAIKPLKTYKKPTAGGGSPGNSSSTSIVIGTDSKSYKYNQPEKLIDKFELFTTENGFTYVEENAEWYYFTNDTINVDFELLSDSSKLKGLINGHIEKVTTNEIDETTRVLLYDLDNVLVSNDKISKFGGYEFKELERKPYKIGFEFDDGVYYYNNYRLVDDISDAEIIDLSSNIISTHNDVYYDNVFPARIRMNFDEIVINNNYYDYKEIRIYDKYGSIYETYDSDSTVTAKISSFYIGIGDYYVSSFVEDSPFIITGLTDVIDEAYLFEADYYDTISEKFYDIGNNAFAVNAVTELKETPLTQTTFRLVDSDISFTITIEPIIDEGEIIVAIYDQNNRLMGLQSEKYNEGQTTYNIAMPYKNDMDRAKVMCWSNMVNLRPLAIAEDLDIPSNLDYEYMAKYVSDVYLVADSQTIYVDNTPYEIDVAPTIIDNVFYAPLRAVSEYLNWAVEYNPDEEIMIISLGEKECCVTVGNTTAVYIDNGKTKNISLSGAPIIINERLLLPYGDIAEILGYDVYVNVKSGVMAIFDGISKKVKYAYDNKLLDSSKFDITAMNYYITREQIAALIVSIYENNTGITIMPTENPYSDTEDEDVLKATALGVFKGFEDGTFKPNNHLTYAEVIRLLCLTIYKIDSGISDKYVSVPEYSNYPSTSDDGLHWCTESLYTAKRLGLLDDIFYDEIENIDNSAIINDVVGLFANGQYQLIYADETEFLYICNSSEKCDGIVKAMQTDLYQYYGYSKLSAMTEEELLEIAQVMYNYCDYYSSVEEFDKYLKIAFDEVHPSAPSGGNYS